MAKTNGMYRSKEWNSWDHMKRRCNNPNSLRYPKYGAKGITVCKEWTESFDAFLKHVGLAPSPTHTIDRYPNKGGNYEPGNVRWATKIEQARNTKKNKIITYNDESLCVAEWSERLGIGSTTILKRLSLGMPVEKILDKNTRSRNVISKEMRETVSNYFKNGLSQKEIFKLTGISQPSISRIISCTPE